MSAAIKIFSKSFTDTDTRKRLSIPVKILPALPDFNGSQAVKIHLTYGTGRRVWPVVCSVRKNGYKKPVFTRGWRNFVMCNNFDVGDKLTLYKVLDEVGSFLYRVEVEKLGRPSGDFCARALSLNNNDSVNETTGTSRTQLRNFEYEQDQEQVLKAADAPIKEEGGATMELANVERVMSKPSCWIFGTNLSDKATGKAQFQTEHRTDITKDICKSEPQLHSYSMTQEEREIEFFGLATGEARYNNIIERLSFGLVQGHATSSPNEGEVNLELTLAPPIVD